MTRLPESCFSFSPYVLSSVWALDCKMYSSIALKLSKIYGKYIQCLRFIIHIYSGITHDRVLNGELYAQRLQKLVLYLYLFTNCFMQISLQS